MWMIERGEEVKGKRVKRLMRKMGVEEIYEKRGRRGRGEGEGIYGYVLRGVKVERRDQVWSADITYVRMGTGFMYVAAVIDWFSGYVVAWRLSNTLDGSFCVEMREEALRGAGRRSATRTRGCSARRRRSTGCLEGAGVAVSMDGQGQCSG